MDLLEVKARRGYGRPTRILLVPHAGLDRLGPRHRLGDHVLAPDPYISQVREGPLQQDPVAKSLVAWQGGELAEQVGQVAEHDLGAEHAVGGCALRDGSAQGVREAFHAPALGPVGLVVTPEVFLWAASKPRASYHFGRQMM
jgi:hypothetical protein